MRRTRERKRKQPTRLLSTSVVCTSEVVCASSVVVELLGGSVVVLSSASVVVGLAVVVVSVDVESSGIDDEEEVVRLNVELVVVRLGVLVSVAISDVVDDVVSGTDVVELVELGDRVVLEVDVTVLASVEVLPAVDEELLPGPEEVGESEGAVLEESEAGKEEGEEVGVGLNVLEDREELGSGPSLVVVEEAGSLLASDEDDGPAVVVGSTPTLLEVVVGALILLSDVLLDVVESSVVEDCEVELASDEDAAVVEGGASVVEEGKTDVVSWVAVDSTVVESNVETVDEESEEGETEEEEESESRAAKGERLEASESTGLGCDQTWGEGQGGKLTSRFREGGQRCSRFQSCESSRKRRICFSDTLLYSVRSQVTPLHRLDCYALAPARSSSTRRPVRGSSISLQSAPLLSGQHLHHPAPLQILSTLQSSLPSASQSQKSPLTTRARITAGGGGREVLSFV